MADVQVESTGDVLTRKRSVEEMEASEETALATTNPEKKMKKVKKVKKRRPARVQIDPATFKSEPPPQTGTTFNLWYNKWSGGDRDQNVQHAAPNRCNIARDSGYTKADSVPGSYFCLFFARGICFKGRDCEYLHRLPTIYDQFQPHVDCFGREKFSDYRDDMGGVGSFMRVNRTIYVGRIYVSDDIEEIIARHFEEWGQLERIRVLNNRGVAFIKYSNMANSEFAKEAMAHQSLDHNEVLNVRWATEDPNPQAQKREKRMIEEQAAEAIARSLPPAYVAMLQGRDPQAIKKRKLENNFGLEGYEAPDSVWLAQERLAAAEQARDELALLEASEEPRLIAAAPEAPKEDEKESNGIFSSRTLASLKNRSNGVSVGTKQKPTVAAAPLVSYGSDFDDDD
jgi:hypothetical protein